MKNIDHDTQRQFGIVKVGDALIGIPIAHLSEVFRAENEQDLPQGGDLLDTGINLRGRLVPILKLDALARLNSKLAKPMFGVILEQNQKLLGFFVDDIVGFVTVASDDSHHIENTATDSASVFRTVFHHQDQFVSILDVALLFGLPGIFTCDQPAIADKTYLRARKPVLTFEAGSAFYAVAAVEVYAAIPKQQINKTAIAVGACLGEITYHRRRIPVICPVSIMGLGTAVSRSVTEVVALRFPGDLVLGFAVDAIHKIGSAPAGNDMSVPFWNGQRNFIEKVIVRDDAPEIYVVNLETLTAAQDLLEIASLSQMDQPEEAVIERTTKGTENIIRQKNRYLVVEAAGRLAIPLSQVNRIVPPPDRLTTTQINQRGFRGYFTLSGESIALFDLSECRQRSTIDPSDAKVLLTGPTGHQIGFLVSKVIGIEISEWYEKLPTDATDHATRLVQLGDADKATILPALDLMQAVQSGGNRAAYSVTA